MPSSRFNRLFLSAFVAIIIFIISTAPQCLAQDSVMSYQLANVADESYTYTLNVSIPQSLNDHYKELSHICFFDINYPKFVTPYAVKPIADCLRQIYTNDEVFTNQVLALVHQIPYEVTGPVYYPAETMAMNKGDCDLFSLIAASILKAGGLDVVLLRYVNQSHMNIGVRLTQPPQNIKNAFSVTYENLTYYIAECTSTNWQNGWWVGECPKILRNASVIVIDTKLCEQTAPAQITASFENTDPIEIPIIIPPTFPNIPLPTTTNTQTPTPSSYPLHHPSEPAFTPTPHPVRLSPRPDESPAPNPTQKPTSTASTVATPIPTPVPTTNVTDNLIATPTPKIEPAYSTDTNQLTQQQTTAPDSVYIFGVVVIITAITTAVLMKKIKQHQNNNLIKK